MPLVQAGLMHRGFAFIDVISPRHSTTTTAQRRAMATWLGNSRILVDADFAPGEEITADSEPAKWRT